MKMHTFSLLLAVLLALPLALSAQQPDTLRHSIPAPPVGAQSDAGLGYSVAVEGGYIVVGAPFDDGGSSGVVKVFDSSTAMLLLVIPNPGPAATDWFGYSVDISGTRVVVGAHRDDTGADDAGSAYVYDLASPTPTVPVATLNNPSPAAQDYFGYSVAISGTRVVVGAYQDDMGATDAGSGYVYDLVGATPTVPVATLSNPSLPSSGDYFGYSVAISGTRAVVGAYQDDVGATDAGSAYVYDLAGATPALPVAMFNNPSPAVSDGFGGSLAISGMRVVIGAYRDDTGATNAGSAYIYDLTSATPTVPVATLNNPTPTANDYFGSAVAISGVRVVAGAYRNDSGATDAGRVYIYDLASVPPTVPVAAFNNPSPADDDQFGASVDISSTRVVVGAYRDDTGASNAGSAYGYDLSSGTPTVPVATLNDPGPAQGDTFGCSVAISGMRVVVGARLDDLDATNAGSAYVYDLASATPTVPVATLNNPNPSAQDYFGYSVAISGTWVAIGANYDDAGASNAGSAYVYDLASAAPTVPVATLDNPSPVTGDFFASSVAVSGTRVVVGAFGDDTGASDAGIAYVYDLAGATPTVPVATLNNPSPAASDSFGISVAISGTRVVVGASNADAGATNTGIAYVYDLTSATPSVPVVTLNNPSPAEYDVFGNSVAIAGTRMVIGANGDDTGETDAGSVYVYDLASATPNVPIATLNNPSPAVGDGFGGSVAISGERVVVGAYRDDTGASDAGSAYVYDLANATPAVPVATLNNPNPGPVDYDIFGASVAIDGATAVIGTPLDDTVAADKGAAYVFGPANPDSDGDGLLDIWEHAHFGSTTVATATSDVDHDGHEDLLEEAFNIDPLVSDRSAAPLVVDEAGFLTITLAKRAGVSYSVETAGTLLSAQPDSFSAASTTILINDATTLKARDNVPVGAAPTRFMRVKVTAAP